MLLTFLQFNNQILNLTCILKQSKTIKDYSMYLWHPAWVSLFVVFSRKSSCSDKGDQKFKFLT